MQNEINQSFIGLCDYHAKSTPCFSCVHHQTQPPITPMTILRLAVVLLIAVFSLAMTTHAGRADVLAQAKCDEKVGTFTLAP